jgi:H+/Cl- antiporter ClcA
LIGAAWGRLIGIGMSHFLPDAQLDPGKYALIGAAATLGKLYSNFIKEKIIYFNLIKVVFLE